MQPISWEGVLNGWYALPRDVQLLMQDAAIVLFALAAGKLAGSIAKTALTAKGFDECLRPPWSSAAQQSPQRLTPSDWIGYLCAATVWLAAGWQIAVMNNVADLPAIARNVLVKSWAVASLLVASGLLSGWVSRSLIAVTQSPSLKGRLDAFMPVTDKRAEQFSETFSRITGVIVYVAVFALALTGSAELVGLTSMAKTLQSLWDLGLRLLCVGVVLSLGWLGARWVYAHPDTIAQEGADTSQDHVHSYVRLGLLALSVLFAIALLSGVAGDVAGAGVVITVIALLYLLRDHVRDLAAGFILQAHRPRQILMEGAPLQVKSIGLLLTELNSGEETYLRRNTEALRAVLAAKAV